MVTSQQSFWNGHLTTVPWNGHFTTVPLDQSASHFTTVPLEDLSLHNSPSGIVTSQQSLWNGHFTTVPLDQPASHFTTVSVDQLDCQTEFQLSLIAPVMTITLLVQSASHIITVSFDQSTSHFITNSVDRSDWNPVVSVHNNYSGPVCQPYRASLPATS